MRILEVRRHSIHSEPGKHLSQDGIALAQSVGPAIGPFDRVVTSPVPRAMETALAMGFAITETLPTLGELSADIFRHSGYPAPFNQLSESVALHRDVESFAKTQADTWGHIVNKVDDDAQVLIITHGCLVEFGVIASLPQGNYSEWNGPIGNCEGFRLAFEDGSCVSGEILRISPDQ